MRLISGTKDRGWYGYPRQPHQSHNLTSPPNFAVPFPKFVGDYRELSLTPVLVRFWILLLLRGTVLPAEPRATVVLGTRTRLDPGVTPSPGSFRFGCSCRLPKFCGPVQNFVGDNRELSGIVGLTSLADFIRSVCGSSPPSGLGASLDKLSPVKPTTLGGVFHSGLGLGLGASSSDVQTLVFFSPCPKGRFSSLSRSLPLLVF